MMKEQLVTILRKQSDKAPRSLQKQIGPSEIGGCRRAVWYKTHDQEPTNPNTMFMAAWFGTAIHNAIEKAFKGNQEYLLEHALHHEGILGHIDLIDLNNNAIWDWKTTTKKNLAYFPTKQQITQVQIYGWLANNNGIKVETVGLMAIPRDGNENDIVEWSAPYDEQIALDAIYELKVIATTDQPPAPEKDASFCANYCEFFGACSGRNKEVDGELILDATADQWASAYLEAAQLVKEWEAKLDQAKSELEGVSGTTLSGIRINWTEVSGRKSVDETEVQKLLGFVPTKQGRGYTKISVKP